MEILSHVPEVPITEQWEWLSDVLESYNGEEQRISLRGAVPRYNLSFNLKVITLEDLQRLWTRFIISRNLAWVPEYHLATVATAQTNSGSARIYFNEALTDIRVGENVLIGDAVYEVDSLEVDGVTLTSNLSETLLEKGLIVPVAEATLDSSTVERFKVNHVANINFNSVLERPRSNLIRPGTSDPLTYWNSVPVLDVRPLNNNNPQHSLIDTQIKLDNSVSNIRLVNQWDDSKNRISREYLVERKPLNSCSSMRRDLDYWRYFFEYLRGSARKFWLPTYRDDLTLVGSLADEATTFVVETLDYGTKIFPNKLTHLWLEVETEQGIHRCEVTGVASNSGNTELTVDPAFPSGWVDVVRISYLLPCRLDGDSVEWQHFGTHSKLAMNFRTAENE